MAVKRKVEVLQNSEKLHIRRSSRLEESGKKRRVDLKKEVSESGVVPTEVEKNEAFSRSKNVDGTQKTDKVYVLKDGGPADIFDDEASKNSSEAEDLEEERLNYEEERNRILEENRKRMQELGLHDLTKHLSSTHRTQAHLKSAAAAKRRVNQTKCQAQVGFQPRRSVRHADRTELRKAQWYKDFSILKKEPREPVTQRREYVSQRRTPKRKPIATGAEFYTEEHFKLLGSYENEWKLFCDGYYPDGGRIYDSVNGRTCHQCRQKTLGHRTWCGLCKSLSGQFCGDCLFMRYGENVLEARANINWVCPVCRGICNCSICRVRRGWAPTGNLFRHALAEGFRSVSHYLIMTRRRQPACKGEEVDQGEKIRGVDHLDDLAEKVHQKGINDSNIQPETPSPTQRIFQSAPKIEAFEIVDATPAELHHSNALRVKKEYPCFESENFVMVKVEIQDANNREEIKGGSPSTFCKKIKQKQEEYTVSNQDASQLQKAQKKEIEGTYESRSGDCIGGMKSTDLIHEKERFIEPEDDARITGDHPTLRNACLGLNESVAAKAGSSGCSTLVCNLSEGSKACYEEVLTFQDTETSAEHEQQGKKLSGRTKGEIVRQRLSLKETSQFFSPGMLPSRTQSICDRPRRKEAISYKPFL